jgi:hypothetical protein
MQELKKEVIRVSLDLADRDFSDDADFDAFTARVREGVQPLAGCEDIYATILSPENAKTLAPLVGMLVEAVTK